MAASEFHSYKFPRLAGIILLLMTGLLLFPRSRAAGVTQTSTEVTTVSAASFATSKPVAPNSIVSAFGTNLATEERNSEAGKPLTRELAGTRVTVNGRAADIFYVSPKQVNFLIPAETQAGKASIVITSGNNVVSRGEVLIAAASPGLFNLNGVAIGDALRYRADNAPLPSQPLLRSVDTNFAPAVIEQADQVILVLYGTGLVGGGATPVTGRVTARIGGLDATVEYAGPQGIFAGLDQINIRIDKVMTALQGRGRLQLAVTLDGNLISNPVEIEIGTRQGPVPPQVDPLKGELVAGDPIKINGSGFAAAPGSNTVRIGGVEATVTEATPTQLTVFVPYGAQSGNLTVQTPQGQWVSSTMVSVRTSISGIVQNTLNEPLMGVVVKVQGTSITGTTGKDGRFRLLDPPTPENLILEFDGSSGKAGNDTTGSLLPYPILRMKVRVAANRDNQISAPIALQQINTSAPGIPFGKPGGVMPGIAQGPTQMMDRDGEFVLEVQSGFTAKLPDDTSSGSLRVKQIAESRTPVSLPPGLFSKAVAQITSLGAVLTPSAKLTFPNSDEYKPRELVDIIRLDQSADSDKLGTFVNTGKRGIVSDDGKLINTGSVIDQASIYLLANPNPTTTVVGRVVEKGSNKHIEDAKVIARGQVAKTDGNGTFTLSNVPLGRGDTFSIQATYVSINGRVGQALLTDQIGVKNGITTMEKNLELSFVTSNLPPIISPGFNKEFTINIGETSTKTFVAADPQGGPITVTVTGAPFVSQPTENGNGLYQLILSPPKDSLPDKYKLILAAVNSKNENTTLDVIVQLNAKPVAMSQRVDTIVGKSVAINLTATDPGGDPSQLTYEIVKGSGPRNGSNGSNGIEGARILYTPNPNFVGSDNFSFTVNDGLTSSDPAIVTIIVNPNKPPTLTVQSSHKVTVGKPIEFFVTATDDDIKTPDNNSFTFSVSPERPLPPGAKLEKTGPATARFTWTPTKADFYTIDLSVSDDGKPALSDKKSVTITVTNPENQPPVLTLPGNQTVVAGQELSFTVSASDPDAGQTLTITGNNLPPGATFNQNIGQNSGSFRWTPALTQTPGGYIPNFRVTDNGQPEKSDTKPITITVLLPNRRPTMTVSGNVNVDLGKPVALKMEASDPDSDQKLTFTATGLPPLAEFKQTGPNSAELNWASAQTGTWPVVVTVTDDGAPPMNAKQELTIKVTVPNRAPVLTVPGPQSGITGQPLAFTVRATDPDTDQTVTLEAASLPSGATFNPGSGQFNWTPAAGQAGTYTVTFKATDNGAPPLNDTKTVSLTIANPNQPPVLTIPGAQNVNGGQTVAFTVTATDPDAGQSLSLSASDLPMGATFSQSGGSGQFSWTPSTTQTGSYTVTFRASDNGTPVQSVTRTVTITVANRAPVLTVPVAQSINVGQTLSLRIEATDPDTGQILTLTARDLPAGATFSQSGGGVGQFSWTPGGGQTGNLTVTFGVSDNGTPQQSDTKSVTITVVNRSPVLTVPGSQTVTTGQTLSFSVTAADPDSGQALNFTASGLPSGATLTPTGAAGAQFSWAPGTAQTGTYTVNFRVADNGNPALSDTKSVVITVSLPSLAPILVIPGLQPLTVGQTVSFTVSVTNINPNQTVALSASGLPPGATFNPPVGSTSGEFRWTPGPTQTGTWNTTLSVVDTQSTALRDTRSMTISVINRAPVLSVPGAQSVNAGQPLTVPISATDPDTGQTLTLRATSLPTGASFLQSAGASGQLNWTPTSAQTGSYTVTFTVEDNAAPPLSDTKTVTITVVNRAPVLTVPAAQSVNPGQPVSFTVTATDPDSGQTLSFSAASLPMGATFSSSGNSGGQFSWTPTAAQTGTYTISFSVADNGTPSLSDTKTVRVTVVNRAPVLTVPAAQSVNPGQQVSFTVTATDDDSGQTLTLTASGLPAGAAFNQSAGASGQFTWTPGPTETGSRTVTFTVTDNGNPVQTTTRTVTITVVNRPPSVTVPATQTVAPGEPLSFTVTAADPDSGQTLTLTARDLPAGATISQVNATSVQLSWVPGLTQTGSYRVSFTATDNGNPALSDSKTVTITVVNRAPVLTVPAAQSVLPGQPVSFLVTAIDPDSGQTLTFSASGLPAGAVFNQNNPGNAQFDWTPTTAQTGSFTLTFRVTDNGNPALSDTKTVTITVFNQPPVLTVPGPQIIVAGQQSTITVTAADPDPDQRLTFSVLNLPSGAVLTQTGPTSAQLTWTPLAAQIGNFTLSFAVSDNGSPSLSDTRSVPVSIVGQWQQSGGPNGGVVNSVLVNGTSIYAGTTESGIFLSTNNGQNWTAVNTGLTTSFVYTLAASEGTIFAGTYGGGIFVSTNNGQSWTASNSGLTNLLIFSIAISGGNIFVGTGGGVFLSTDNGQTWTSVRTGLPNLEIRALAISGGNIFAGTFGNGVYLSTNNGQTWTAVNTGMTSVSVRTLLVSGGNVFAGAGSGGGVFVTNNNGQSWTSVNNGLVNLNVYSLSINNGVIYAGTFGSGVFSTTNNGQLWSAVSTGLISGRIYSIRSSGGSLYAGTGAGVFLSTNNGVGWTAANGGLTNAYVYSVLVSGSGIFAATDNGVANSSNNGQNWTVINNGLRQTNATSFVVSGSSIFAGTRGGVFVTSNNGASWTTANTGLINTSVNTLLLSGSNLIAATEGGVFVSVNNGQNWTAANTGLTNLSVRGLAVSGSNLFAVTNGGGIFLSTNNGQRWTAVNTGLKSLFLQSIAISGSNILAGTASDGIFLSTDNGQNWTAINTGLKNLSVNSITFSKEKLFAATSAGVHLSTDNGQNWTTINTGLSNLAVKTLTVSGNRLYAGTLGSSIFTLDF